MTTQQVTRLQKLLTAVHNPPVVTGATLAVARGQDTWQGGVGDMDAHTPYFIASTTKLFVTALVMQQVQAGTLSLADNLGRFLPSAQLVSLHVYKGKDYAAGITLRQLLAHTSGLPDYLQPKRGAQPSLLQDLQQGKDSHWDLPDALALTRAQRPRFAPGTPGKALYSDTNYQLLGYILTQVTGLPLPQLCQQYICSPLGLQHTYMYTDATDTTPLPLRYKRATLAIPQAMVSFGPDGGIVSTAAEQLRFVQAFFGGELFPAHYIPELQAVVNPVMYPLEYGVGMMRFRLPRLFTLGWRMPALWGHSGLSGAFAFYCPQGDLSIAGTVNQVHAPGRSFRLMVRVLQVMG